MKSLAFMIGAILFTSVGPAWGDPAAGPGPGQIVPGPRNEELERKIMANLLTDPELKNNRIDVAVAGTTVTLKGKVDSDSERARAARLAQVDGITVVHDQLEVGSQGVEEAVTDTAITTKLRAQFLGDETLRRANLSVTTNNGVVTLKGVVPSRSARARAVDLASHSYGVNRVEDRLQVTSH
ncbi:MAG TPA: BON domain-containing protein [Polyangia bacterium]|nr:BON domain-containing protein [Polyangia bacterium]